MNKEELEKIPNYTEDNTNEKASKKNLCVHELTRKLKKKQRKENIGKAIILLIVTFLIFFLSVIIY